MHVKFDVFVKNVNIMRNYFNTVNLLKTLTLDAP